MSTDTRLEALRLAITHSRPLEEIMKRAHYFEAFLNSTPVRAGHSSLAAERMQVINEDISEVIETIRSWEEGSDDLSNAVVSLNRAVHFIAKHLHPLEETP